ncbi:uncharacterized protein AAGF69_004786 isoform 2-T2 [Amazona ochrocephala]
MAAGRVRVPAAAAAALCPGRFVTYTDVQASYRYKPNQRHYFKQFCKPGVNSPRKVCMHQEVMEYFHVVAVLCLLLKSCVMKIVLR